MELLNGMVLLQSCLQVSVLNSKPNKALTKLKIDNHDNYDDDQDGDVDDVDGDYGNGGNSVDEK